ncbi:MAG: EAL domain-containing response regulator [Pseudohongiellaceae bacterium]
MEHQSEGSQSTTKIVLVDDDQFQLKLLSHQLSMVGYKNVTAFDDGQTALDHMAGQVLDFTVVILDLNMPKMDGLEFLQQLQEVQFSGALLLVSGEDERVLQSAETLASSYDLRVLGHLNKPVQQEQLQQYLKQLAAQKKKSSEGEKLHVYKAERLQQAIATGELSNFYQPKVNLESGALVGVEALVRWEHPEDGIILPDNFIDLAEENELIDRIAQQVLSNALKDSKLWKDAGIDITIAVNISMYNLNTREFISYLENELLTSGVNPQDLILEVTESKLMRDYSLVLDMLTRLRLRRVNLSIDDFGTGHSSMTQLRDIPFNELKIDRGFVHCACDNATLHGIFDGSIQLAKNLGIKTVAEGVENEADWSFLGGSGCDIAQGYFIGKPMRAVELSEWKTDWAERYAKIAV